MKRLFLHRVRLQGLMPERSLLKLKRNEIPLYDVKKTTQDSIECSIPQEYLAKLFAIYPSFNQSQTSYAPFTATDLGLTGIGKLFDRLHKRIGVILGALCFCMITLSAQQLVFGVELVGSSVYQRETLIALEEYGVKTFRVYSSKNEDLICAKLLSLPDVEFCSVQKVGTRVRVEVRLFTLPNQQTQKGDMRSLHTGTITSITTLRGTPAKNKGEKISQGETLVYGWYIVEGKGQVSVEPIARVSIACAYEKEIQAENEEQAFARAYLELALNDGDFITEKQIQKTETGFFVRIHYTAIESFNL